MGYCPVSREGFAPKGITSELFFFPMQQGSKTKRVRVYKGIFLLLEATLKDNNAESYF